MQKCRTLLSNGKTRAVSTTIRAFRTELKMNGISIRLLLQLCSSPPSSPTPCPPHPPRSPYPAPLLPPPPPLPFHLLLLLPLFPPPRVVCFASLGLLVRKVRDSHVLSIVSTLSKNIFLDKEELRDISGIGERKKRMCVLSVCMRVHRFVVCLQK